MKREHTLNTTAWTNNHISNLWKSVRAVLGNVKVMLHDTKPTKRNGPLKPIYTVNWLQAADVINHKNCHYLPALNNKIPANQTLERFRISESWNPQLCSLESVPLQPYK